MEIKSTSSNASPTVQDRVSLSPKNEPSKATTKRIAQKDNEDTQSQNRPETDDQKTSGINKYLKLVLLLEKKVSDHTIDKAELGAIMENLQKRLDQLNEKDKKSIFGTKEAKALKLDPTKPPAEELLDKIMDPAQSEKVFALLKSRTFIQTLRGEQPPLTYQRSEILRGTKPDDTKPGIDKKDDPLTSLDQPEQDLSSPSKQSSNTDSNRV